LLETNQYLLEHGRDNSEVLSHLDDCVILPPVNIHPDVRASQSVLGPNLSIGAGTVVQGSILRDSIIGTGAHITRCRLESTLLGHDVTLTDQSGKLNLGDDSWATR